MAWQTPVVGILLVIQFAIAQALGAEPSSGIVLAPMWKIIVLPALNVGVGFALNQLKPVGAAGVIRSVAVLLVLFSLNVAIA